MLIGMTAPLATAQADAIRSFVESGLYGKALPRAQALLDVLRRCESESPFTACEAAGIPYTTFTWWLERVGLVEVYTRARAARAARLVEESLEEGARARQLVEEGDVQRSGALVAAQRLAVDSKHWAATRMGRDDWSERYQTTQLALGIKGADGSEIVVRWGAPEGK